MGMLYQLSYIGMNFERAGGPVLHRNGSSNVAYFHSNFILPRISTDRGGPVPYH
jgi:hypothetical protein